MANATDFDLASGRRLYLKELRQYLTYGGLLMGLPTVEWNKRMLVDLIAEYTDKPYEGEPYLIEPIETPIKRDHPYSLGTPSALPGVTCIGRYESIKPARDENSDYSGLVIIWYQNEFAFPIDPVIFTELSAIDWEAHAVDMEW